MSFNIVSTILGPIFNVIDKAVLDKTKAAELKAEIERMTIENQGTLQDTMREIAVNEVRGNWFQSSWRPLLSYTFIFLVIWSFFLKGVIEASFGVSIESGSPNDVMMFGTVWSAVYGLGRTFEKTGSQLRFTKE